MTSKNAQKIAARLRDIRNGKKLTQAEVAAKAGISRTYYVLIEGGHKNPTTDVLLNITDALGVSTKDIVGK